MASNGQKAYGGFGYPLHIDEHRGGSIDFDDVPQIPIAARHLIDRCGEEYLTPDLEKQMDASIAEAKQELFARHLAAMRMMSGGNQYDVDGKPVGDQDDNED